MGSSAEAHAAKLETEAVHDGREAALTTLQEWRRGWPVVLAAGIGYGTGGAMLLLAAGMFLIPMREELGWSTSALTFAPITSLVMALCLPFTGLVIDRIGSRLSALLGMAAFSACMASLAFLPMTQPVLYGVAVLAGVVCSLTVAPTFTRAIASWFKQGLGSAIGLALSGSAIVAVGAFPIIAWALKEHGWRGGFLAMAGITFFVGLPAVALAFKERGEGTKKDPNQTVAPVAGHSIREALSDGRFWVYLTVFTLACIPLGGFVAHMQPLLRDQGFSMEMAVSLGVLFALSISGGRIVGGFLLDRIWPFAVAAGLLFTVGLAAIALGHAEAGWAFALIVAIVCGIGVGQGAEADFIVFFGVRAFGLRAYSTIIGILAMATTVAISIGAIGFSALYDRFGNYEAACYVGAVLLFVASGVILTAGRFEKRAGGLPPERIAH